MIKHSINGAVYGVILNDTTSLQKIGALDIAPYKGAPKSPALYIKPANTLAACGATVSLPRRETAVEVGATVGLVMGREASQLDAATALDAVAGLVLAADLSLPHDSYYRPAIREKCFDGSLPVSPLRPLADLSALTLITEIDGQIVEQRSLADLIFTPAQLLAEITAFMTLRQGDVLLVGVGYKAPQAKAGSRVEIRGEGSDSLGRLKFTIAQELQGGAP